MEKTARILNSYLQLTKPSIMLLVLFTGATSLVLEGSFLAQPMNFALVMLGLFLTGGSANALNQYIERNLDAKMTRTRNRRPLPTGAIGDRHALVFSVTIGIVGIALFAIRFNWLTALLSLATILFYVWVYTLLLKPNTPQNIVIGGIAGAMAPLGAWTAATGTLAAAPWILFLLVFLWTPPHFWALALFCQDDYRAVGLPMMPIVKGELATLRQITVYTVIVFVVSLSLLIFGAGLIYLLVALALGGIFIQRALRMQRQFNDVSQDSLASARKFFGFSILYLFGLFTAIMVDSVIPFAPWQM